MADEPNISTEHQPKGSAINLSDTLDRPTEGAGRKTLDQPDKSAEEYRREYGDKPDSATATHAPPPPDANPDA
ncbi:MAG: hypothetical protein JWM38_1218 [Sphingomonas bacterium]|jgi:hypothetical protein|nr:hypothetical protein [Sphingomonas bacterium]MDB5717791.1 hypothetical protein [Sphingomonas bacterium]